MFALEMNLEGKNCQKDDLYISDAFVTSKNFYDDSINYFDMQRLGGLLSHLKKTYKGNIFISHLI